MSDDDTTTFEITRRRALGALVTVGAGAAAAGAGTFAAFSDTETGTTKQVTASTLDLQVEPVDDPENNENVINQGGQTVLQLGSLAPGDVGALVCRVENAGDTAANLTVELGSLSAGTETDPLDNSTLANDTDNVNTDPEVETDGDLSSGDEDSISTTQGQGELAANLNVEMRLTGVNPSGISNGVRDGTQETDGTVMQENNGDDADGIKAADLPGTYSALADETTTIPLDGGDVRYLILNFDLPESVGNVVQGDAVAFDTLITLNQDTSQ